MLKKKNKKIAVSCLSIAFMGCSIVGVLANVDSQKANAATLVSELFYVDGMQLQEGYNNQGLLFTASEVKAHATFKNALVGDFEFSLSESVVPKFYLDFTDVNNERNAFTVGVEEKNDVLNVFVELDEQTIGLYYTNGSLSHSTENKNNGGVYTQVQKGNNSIFFDVETMTVFAKSKTETLSVWTLKITLKWKILACK